ncbi:MAG: hypothetical protein J0M37_09745 [Ignavibacteria bacterium]|nr:hypothetical protein [Ignavibacteria bacterium]
MKIIFTLLLLFFAFNLNSQVRDTAFTLDINFDREDEKIICSYDERTHEFTLKINDQTISHQFMDSYDYAVEVIDMNRNDNLKEVIVKGYGNSDQSDMYFFQFINGKIVPCGHLPSNFGIEVTGNSEITEHAWMGFWTAKIRYDFDTKNKTLTRINDEFYDVNQECEVKTPFRLLVKRDDNSETAVTLAPKTKLTIIKADITPVCKYEDGTDDDFSCDWFLFKTSDGKQGWCRLKDFQQNVDGLIWAG